MKAEETSSWEVAFALADEIEMASSQQRAKDGEIARCRKFLADAGYERSSTFLSNLFTVGRWAGCVRAPGRKFMEHSLEMARVAMAAGLDPDEALKELRRAKDGEIARCRKFLADTGYERSPRRLATTGAGRPLGRR